MKKIIATVLILILPFNAFASLQGTLDSMFMTNGTAGGALSTADRTGYSLGGFAARAPVKPITLAAFDPPRMNAGCGGLDIYGGSFSFINADQFTALIRQIMANAIGLMFQAALKAINPMIADLANYFQDVVNGLNKMTQNTCAIAHQLTDQGFNPSAIANSFEDSWSKFSATTGAATDTLKTKFASKTEQAANAKAAENEASLNASMGNLTWRALARSKAYDQLDFMGSAMSDDTFKAEVLMSLLGTQINSTTSATPDQSVNAQDYIATLRIKDLVNDELSLSNMQYMACVDGGGGQAMDAQYGDLGCPKVDKVQMPFSGTYPYVLNMLYGDPVAPSAGDIILNAMTYNSVNLHPNSIVSKLTTNSTGLSSLTVAQKSFLRSFPVSILQIIVDAQSDMGSVSQIFSMVAKYAAYDMALRIGQAASGAGRNTWTKVPLPKVDNVDKGLKQIDEDVALLATLLTQQQSTLKAAAEMAQYVRINNPNTRAAKVGGA